MLLLVLGCTWVGQADYDARLSELDDDGDAFTRDGGDCDDSDATIFPGADEVWYDGVDQDCGGDDDFDQDGDGFRQADAPDHAGQQPDCNDKSADIYPFAPDTWYDNVDSDCQDNDDFDADFDGVRSKTGAGDDCDDEPADDAEHGGPGAAATYPGAQDAWYDGVDQDCAGDDDFDQDADGYVAEQWFDDATPPATLWCASCGTANKGDCDDDPTDDGTSILPAAEVYSGHADTWYDGVDQDCAGDDDFDRDLDGYADDDSLVDGQVPATEHCADCPLSVPGDCDDSDELIFPNAIEDPSSNDDQDCDGAADSVGVSADADIGWSFTDPYSILASETSTELWFSVSARSIEDHQATTYDDTAVAFSLSFANPDLGLQSIVNWQAPGSNFDITGGQAFTLDGTDFLGATGLQGSSNRTLVVSRTPNGGSRQSVSAPQSLLTSVEDVDVAVAMDSAGTVHAISCDYLTGIHYVRAEPSDFTGSTPGTSNLLYSAYAPEACVLEMVGTTGYIAYSDANDGGARVWLSFDSTTTPSFSEISRDATVDGVDLFVLNRDPDLVLVIADQVAGVIEIESDEGTDTITPDTPPVTVQAVLDPTDPDRIIVTWADEDGNAGIAWGELGGSYDLGTFDVLHSVIQTSPRVSADGLDLFVALLGSGEVSVERLTPPS